MRLSVLLLATVALAGCRVSDAGNQAAGNESGNVASDATKPAVELSLTRLDCGAIHVNDMDKSFGGGAKVYPPGSYELTDSCYLIRHGDKAMIWDTGFPEDLIGHPFVDPGQTATLKESLLDELKAGGIKPEQINFVGISHYHGDHTGQAHAFPGATLLIGAADWDALKAKSSDPFMQMSQKAVAPWLSGKSKVEAVSGDKDVFGDGRVTMLALPGHTPGHHSLLVKLKSGAVLLSGDLYHATAARTKRGVPPFNTDKAQTLQSMDKFEALAKQTGAKVIIQHEPADVGKLPVFPEAAK